MKWDERGLGGGGRKSGRKERYEATLCRVGDLE